MELWQIWDLLEWTMQDQHPDATACRLKISFVTSASRSYMPIPWNEAEEYRKYVTKINLISAECRLHLLEEEHFLSKSDSSIEDIKNRRSLLTALRKGEKEFSATLASPAWVKTFDEMLDTTCVEVSPDDMKTMAIAGAMAFATYAPPSAGLGSGALRFLNKLIDSKQLSLTGITSSGSAGNSSNYNGFILCYELLCNQLELKILKDDLPRNLGSLLTRAIPVKETSSKGLLSSILRVIIWNPEAASSLPGYYSEMLKAKAEAEKKDPKQTGIVALVADKLRSAFDVAKFHVNFLESIAEKLTEANSQPREAGSHSLGSLHWPTIKAPYSSSENVSIVSADLSPVDNQVLKLYNGLITPRMAEITCSRRIFVPVRVQVKGSRETRINLEYDAEAVRAFSTMPMQPLGLESLIYNLKSCDSYVEAKDSDEEDEKACVTDFYSKFRIMASPPCRSSRAQSTVMRLAKDLRFVQRSEKSISPLEINGFSGEQIRRMLNEPSLINEAMLKLRELQDKLMVMHAADNRLAQECIDEALSILSNIIDSEVSHSLFDLAHDSGQAPQCSFESISSLLLDECMSQKLLDYNPYLSPASLANAENLLVGAMFSLNRAGHVARCILNVQDILQLCEKASSSLAADDDSLLTSIALKSSSLAELLCTTRGYSSIQNKGKDKSQRAENEADISSASLKVSYDPRFLVFEFTSNIMLRNSQIKLVRRFIDAYHQGGSLCHQLIMGAGKTTVIAPMLALILGSPNQLVVQVCIENHLPVRIL